MRRWVKFALVVGVLGAAFFLSGCFFNALETARVLRQGDVALTLGLGFLNLDPRPLEEKANPILTPQVRLAAGITDGLELSLHSGLMVSPTAEQPGFMGAVGNLKASLVDDPQTISLAVGFGGGWSLPMAGWGLQASLYLDSDLGLLPIYLIYRPIFPLGGDEFTIWNQLVVGLHLKLSKGARLLLEVDSFNGVLGIAVGLETVL